MTPSDRPGPVEKALVWIGAPALFTTVALDTSAVVFRQFGRSLPGSTEIVQFAIVLATAIAVITATYMHSHAIVNVLTDRIGDTLRGVVSQLARVTLFLLFVVLAAASGWLLSETWLEPERSDLLGLPIAPLRLVWLLALLVCAGLCLHRLTARSTRSY